MPYTYSSSHRSRRRLRHLWARIGAWARLRAFPVLISTATFLLGLILLIRRQPEDVISGGVLCVVGTALLAVALPKFISYDASRDPALETDARDEAHV